MDKAQDLSNMDRSDTSVYLFMTLAILILLHFYKYQLQAYWELFVEWFQIKYQEVKYAMTATLA